MSDGLAVTDVKERFWRRGNPLAYGAVITALVLAAYVFLGFQKECIATVCETNFQKFWGADPNEMGDTLAGLFGALAFIWVIVTVLLQGQELREQRKEFREQRIATQDMARAMDVQADALEFQFRRNVEEKNFEYVLELLADVFQYAEALNGLIWFAEVERRKQHPLRLVVDLRRAQSWEDRLNICAQVYDKVERIQWRCREGEMFPDSHKPYEVFVIVGALDEIATRMADLPEVARHRMERAGFFGFWKSAKVLNEDPVFWLPK